MTFKLPIGTVKALFRRRPLFVSISDLKTHIHVIGVTGCLHPDTPIFDPRDKSTRTVYQRYLLGQPFRVVALNEQNKPVIARAEAPKQFTREKMYRVRFSNGESVTVTGQHRIFVGNGYREVRHLVNQSGFGEGYPLPSISGNDLLKSLSSVRRWRRIGAGFQVCCHQVSRLYGRRFQAEGDSGQASSPSPDDARIPGFSSCGKGGSGKRGKRNLLQDSAPSSMRGFSYLGSSNVSGERGYHSPVNDDQRYRTFHRSGLPPVSDSSQSYKDELPLEPSLASIYDENRAYEYNHRTTGATQCQVVAVEEAGDAVYYDFHVPKYENYWACGVFHHNSGKSRFLAGFLLEMMKTGCAVTLVDPHGDLARLVLLNQVKSGVYGDYRAFERMIYLDIPTAERRGLYVPLNLLAQNLPPHTIATNIKEAFHRAWPALGQGAAPMFDTLVLDGVKVLVSNGLPLTFLYRLLSSRPFRESLLANEEDEDIKAFFHDQFDRLSPRDQADQAGSALRRAHLLTFSPLLKHSLGQKGLLLDFRKFLDEGRNVIVNLSVGDSDARKLLGCLLTVSIEQAALSRAEIAPEERVNDHHLVLDEFAEFSAQSEEALSRILSQCRKYGLYVVMAHQSWSQTSERLKGAMQNVGMEVAFRQGREDAEESAKILGKVDPAEVKHMVEDPSAIGRTHPMYSPLMEQWEGWTQELQNLAQREAFVKTPSGKMVKIKTLDMPDPKVDAGLLRMVEEEYLRRYFVPEQKVVEESAGMLQEKSPEIGRMERVR